MKRNLLILLVAGIIPTAGAQSLNVDFNWNGIGTVPTSSYGAAGLVGTWNSANVSTTSITNLALVDLSGSATTAVLNVPNFGGNWSNSGPWTGNDSSLMEDLIGSGSNSSQILLTGLQTGSYQVIMYGMNATGNSTSSFTINSITQTTGGAWSGSHVAGASYTSFNNVLVPTGNLTINFLGNANGMQLRYQPVPEPISLITLIAGAAGFGLRRSRRKPSA